MNKLLTSLLCVAVAGFTLTPDELHAQQLIHYTGKTIANPMSHDGRLQSVVGVHNIQTMRANREMPETADDYGWTYNHQSMIAYWNNTFFVEYLSNPVGEHIPSSHTYLLTSKDGYNWEKPVVLFPAYRVPDGFSKEGSKYAPAKDLDAIMHQRVGFFVSKEDRLLAIGCYNVALHMKDDPNDGNGIGRVVREIKKDGSFGEIFFIRYNHQFNAKNTNYRFYKKSKDKGFVRACDELLANPLYQMQFVEEADRNDPLIPLRKGYKAFNYYHTPDGKVACLWKHALTSVSEDGGKTWSQPVNRAKGFVNSNAKIWGQRLSDGKYATVYNPAEFRWPLAMSLSHDGYEYKTLNVVHGEISPMRYGGNYKSYGPQYVRGIQEGNGCVPDSNMWITYSVNKEDIWVARVPVPVRAEIRTHANDRFEHFSKLADMTEWNIYSPLWSPVSLEKGHDGKNKLVLADKDPYDYAKVERKLPASRSMEVSFDVTPSQNDHGQLFIEFQDATGVAGIRIFFDADGMIKTKTGYRNSGLMPYEAGKTYNFNVKICNDDRNYVITCNDRKATRLFFIPLASVEKVVFRTGEPRYFPTIETPTDQSYDLENAGKPVSNAAFALTYFTSGSENNHSAAVLKAERFKGYADYFNRMEDENIVQAIPNDSAWEWMKTNIPLFETPQKNFEEMFYFRWWNLRKHIKQTPVGYGMTEFLVNRSYADQYNLIACAVGHHIYESRWLHNPTYLDQIIKTWYRGNNGEPMKKMRKFSSWNPDAIYNRYLVDGDKDFLFEMYPDMQKEYAAWEGDHRLENGLYWQGDVQDGMEESISGGRRKKYARPTINSYMYGNAVALAKVASMKNDTKQQGAYQAKAEEIKNLVQNQLWNNKNSFFETRRPDSLANVREAIGYIPWYFNLPDAKKYDVAWGEVKDPKGFLSPYGLTTAERRHPEFRTRGVGKCEWDGAIWPFASSQTMTAMANFMNNYDQNILNDSVYFRLMELYVESQYHRGRPYIGEYQDEVTGYWLKGDQERSRYYNHSTFNDMIITGLIGLRPAEGNDIVVNPLIPEGTWNWFCLDNIRYHGRIVTILWDADGSRYGRGKGLQVLVDGQRVGQRDSIGHLVCKDALKN
ncbi:MAG: exo-alpha-sialidase [Bacteroidales bacterium]